LTLKFLFSPFKAPCLFSPNSFLIGTCDIKQLHEYHRCQEDNVQQRHKPARVPVALCEQPVIPPIEIIFNGADRDADRDARVGDHVELVNGGEVWNSRQVKADRKLGGDAGQEAGEAYGHTVMKILDIHGKNGARHRHDEYRGEKDSPYVKDIIAFRDNTRVEFGIFFTPSGKAS